MDISLLARISARARKPDSHLQRRIPGAAGVTLDDAIRRSARDLAIQGCPRRPDPQQAPQAFAAWLKAVTKPATFVPPAGC
jgi:hypothetical protein